MLQTKFHKVHSLFSIIKVIKFEGWDEKDS
jgi:hypothetical protein